MNKKDNFSFWQSAIAIPFSIEIVFALIVFILYFWLVFFIFFLVYSNIIFALPFIYIAFALLYAIWAYFRSGIAIPWSLSIGYIQFTIKNFVIILMISIVLIVSFKLFYKPPQLRFSDLEVIEEKISKLNNNYQDIKSKNDQLESFLAQELESSDFLQSVNDYQVFYSSPPNNIYSYSEQKLNQLNDDYFALKSELKEKFQYVNESKILLNNRGGAINSLEETSKGLKSQIETACDIKNNKNSSKDQDTINPKIAYCQKISISLNKLIDDVNSIDISVYASDLDVIEKNTSNGQKYLQVWNNWLASARGVVDTTIIDEAMINSWLSSIEVEKSSSLSLINESKKNISGTGIFFQGITLSINEIEQELDKLKPKIDKYEKAENINFKLIKDAKDDLSSVTKIPDQIKKIDSSFEPRLNQLSEHLEKIGDSISAVTSLYSRGDNLVNSKQFTPSARKMINNVNTTLSDIEKIKQEQTALQNEINTKIKELKKFSQDQSKTLGGLDSSARNIESRLDFFIKDAEPALIVSRFLLMFIGFIFVGIISLVFWNNLRIQRLKKMKSLEKNQIDELLKKIEDTKEDVYIRKGAVKSIYDHYSLDEKQIKKLKDTLRKLEKRASDEDMKVLEELRKVTDALETRLMEKRPTNK